MNKLLKSVGLLAVAGFLVVNAGVKNSWADPWKTETHVVTVNVPDVLTLTSDTPNIVLNFDTWTLGSETNVVPVVYTFEANNMTQAADAPVVNVNLDNPFDRVDLQAKVGSVNRVSGNAGIQAISSDFVTIGTSNTSLANKTVDSGTDGKMFKGNVGISYKGVATGDVPSGAQIHNLYVTFTTV